MVVAVGVVPAPAQARPWLRAADARDWAKLRISWDLRWGLASRAELLHCKRTRSWRIVCFYREWDTPLAMRPSKKHCPLADDGVYRRSDWYEVVVMRHFRRDGGFWTDDPNEPRLLSCPIV